ncbi:hypothetical protein NX722_26320 [Endozoicomonas gorgoniicola]|uniref:Peptidase C58 YopT-type domain-containing protein n=1 Tax=Endozoicomonas gorgoniicola TaxID=1234144 RepID=A0ABT3N380_9GAMM|nr:hypothetical protein [Endozoicomonas gorgoniicola]MCW7556081.1 hypothetical protein [Endozoicomonas gorgoniicola]
MGLINRIFSMDNVYSTEARWKQSTSSDGDQQVTASFSRVGCCSSMVAVWIKKSIATDGRGLSSATELGTVHLMGVVQSAYVNKTLFNSKKQDYGSGLIYLLQSQNLITQERMIGHGHFNPEIVVNWVLSKPGHYILLFFNEKGSHSVYNGHAIGFRHEGNHMEMFEPNRGLFSYSDQSIFLLQLELRVARVLHKLMGGPWYLHRVVSDTEPASLSGEQSQFS